MNKFDFGWSYDLIKKFYYYFCPQIIKDLYYRWKVDIQLPINKEIAKEEYDFLVAQRGDLAIPYKYI